MTAPLTLAEGAVQPWVRAGSSSPWLSSLLGSLAEAYGFSTKVPVKKLKKKHLDLVLYGNKGKTVRMTHRTNRGKTFEWDTTFEGVINNLQRRYKETESDYVRTEIERYMTSRPCKSCEGRRLKPEALAVRVGGLDIMEVTDKSITLRRVWPRPLAIGVRGLTLEVDPRTGAIVRLGPMGAPLPKASRPPPVAADLP